jgi:excisionase family DNA binding protein
MLCRTLNWACTMRLPAEPPPEQHRRGYRVKTAAKILDISERTLWDLIAQQKIRSIMLSARCRVIPSSEIDRVLQHGTDGR